MQNITITKKEQNIRHSMDWGELTWYAGRQLANSDDMTVGRCVLNPGKSNPVHSHPNCAEVLVVQAGRIVHTFNGGDEVEMTAGDTITIPAGVKHNARNIGESDADLFIAFSSADRETRGE